MIGSTWHRFRRVPRGALAGFVTLAMAAGASWPAPEARAACVPAAGAGTPASGTTVTCSGATANQNNPYGYGDGSQNGLTVNVQPGASVTGTAAGININDDNTVNNFGTVTTGGTFGIEADFLSSNTLTVNNYGTISSGDTGVVGYNIVLTNTGTISVASTGVFAYGNATIVNSGVISATNTGGVAGINVFGNATIVNSGFISGPTGIVVDSASTLSNSGTIIGINGPAIDFSASAADTLNFQPGSRVTGTILLGEPATPSTSRPAGTSHRSSPSVPAVPRDRRYRLDRRRQRRRALRHQRQSGRRDRPDGVRHGRPRADGFHWRHFVLDRGPSGRRTVGNGDDGLGRSAFRRQRRSGPPPRRPRPSGRDMDPGLRRRTQPARRRPDFGVTSGFGGAAIGIDRQATPDLRLGALAGGGAGSLGVDLGAQTVDTVYGFAGAYGRYEWNGRLLDFSLTGGYRAKQQRAPGGEQSGGERDRGMRTRSYDNWFVSPELGLSRSCRMRCAGAAIIPAARLRYLAAGSRVTAKAARRGT